MVWFVRRVLAHSRLAVLTFPLARVAPTFFATVESAYRRLAATRHLRASVRIHSDASMVLAKTTRAAWVFRTAPAQWEVSVKVESV